jgi:hypothetical protein
LEYFLELGSSWYAIGNRFADQPGGAAAKFANETVIKQIQYELMTNGPLSVGIQAYEDFYRYTSGKILCVKLQFRIRLSYFIPYTLLLHSFNPNPNPNPGPKPNLTLALTLTLTLILTLTLTLDLSLTLP